MGTRADFYIGRGEKAEWLGSVAYDGHPDSIDDDVIQSTTEEKFRAAVAAMIGGREDGTKPEMGWPWPWDNSHTTDYSYAFDGGEVYGSCYGHKWFDARKPEPDEHGDDKPTVFPDMTDRKAVTFGKRSGLLIFGL